MLSERRVERFSYATDRDEASLSIQRATAENAAAGAERTYQTAATLLLDVDGHLVGVDVGTSSQRRVLMLGPHEAVRRTAHAEVSVSKDGGGEISLVRISEAKRFFQTQKPNPYV